MTANRRLNCRKVDTSWHKPTRLAWLNFGCREIAQRVCTGFNTGQHKIQGQSLEASLPQISGSLDGRSRYSHTGRNRVPWTVLLNNVPATATQSEIATSLPTNDRPRHVELSRLDHATDEDTIVVSVESLLTSIGPVHFEMRPTPPGRRIRGRACFEDGDHARIAIGKLNDKPQAFLNQAKLTAQLISSSKYKVRKAIYDSVKMQLDAQRALCEERHVKFRVYLGTAAERFVVLKIEGEHAEHVKAATDAVEAVLAGLVIKDSNSPLWSPALTNGATHPRLKQVQREHGIVLIRDKSKRQLRFFGPPAKYESVCEALVASFEVDLGASQTIPLNAQQFAWACRGGFTQVVQALGQDITSFDVASEPKRIVVTGPYEHYRRALAIVQAQDNVYPPESPLDAHEDCAICYTEAEDPVDTPCGHRYCLDCFANMCTSTASGDYEIPIHCTSGVDRISSAAVPTPDCGNVFRATATAKGHTCTGCFTTVCTACYRQHGFMTCAEYQDLESGGYAAFEKFKKEMQIKDCPKCSTPMEKTDGCNHMTCQGCGTHICWVCMRTFGASGPCYDHMNKAHGSIGLGEIDYVL
ncbi:hypothetical protein LTS09_017566 [Friedmanniomyces endolithicus]|nr:hypothetical protein LTS09_017566 [Friedmanniomyces endolithicus]